MYMCEDSENVDLKSMTKQIPEIKVGSLGVANVTVYGLFMFVLCFVFSEINTNILEMSLCPKSQGKLNQSFYI